jgi:hypothetical protein
VPNEVEGRWLLNLYPDAAEAGGCLQTASRPGGQGDPFERPDDRSAAEAARRAKGQVRRYCAANRLNRMGDVTYAGAGCHDPAQLRADLGEFFRGLRRRIGEPFPYVWVPEWHKTDHGLHAHFAVARYVPRRWIVEAWGRGYVWIHFATDMPVGSTARDEARRAARYLAKYIGKDFGRGGLGGRHRYDVAQGFQPSVRRLTGASVDEVLDQAAAIMGGPPRDVWDSAEKRDWDGPHAVWAQWA